MSGKKVCRTCGAEKPLSAFHRKASNLDGLQVHCAPCRYAALKAWRAANPELHRGQRERKLARLTEDQRAVLRDRTRAYHSERYRRDPAPILRQRREYIARNPAKELARRLLADAVRRGLLKRPATCSQCGAGGRIHGHHPSHDRPYDVVWVCTACHGRIHRKHRCASIPAAAATIVSTTSP